MGTPSNVLRGTHLMGTRDRANTRSNSNGLSLLGVAIMRCTRSSEQPRPRDVRGISWKSLTLWVNLDRATSKRYHAPG